VAECVVCRTDVQIGAKFCPSCGAEQPRNDGASESEDPFIGQVISQNFKIVKLLGVGGMGKVYKALQLSLDKYVVIKVLHDHFRDDPQLVQRFQREARAASRLNHPNSIQVIDFGQAESGVLFMAIEYLDGIDLFSILHREGPMPAVRVARIMVQVCSALSEAHDMNVIHRDLKPENIMVEDRRGRKDIVKVLDFGIAKIQDPDEAPGQALTQAGMVCGTPEYMSPEQARGHALDARSDLYAIGVLTYQLSTGELPFQAETPIGIVTKHILEKPEPAREAFPELQIPEALDAIMLKAMEKEPGDRFQTAAEMGAAYEKILEVPARIGSGPVVVGANASELKVMRDAFAAEPAPSAPTIGDGELEAFKGEANKGLLATESIGGAEMAAPVFTMPGEPAEAQVDAGDAPTGQAATSLTLDGLGTPAPNAGLVSHGETHAEIDAFASGHSQGKKFVFPAILVVALVASGFVVMEIFEEPPITDTVAEKAVAAPVQEAIADPKGKKIETTEAKKEASREQVKRRDKGARQGKANPTKTRANESKNRGGKSSVAKSGDTKSSSQKVAAKENPQKKNLAKKPVETKSTVQKDVSTAQKKAVSKADRKKSKSLMAEAQTKMVSGKVDSAYSLLRKARDLDPKNYGVIMLMSRYWTIKKVPEKACRAMKDYLYKKRATLSRDQATTLKNSACPKG
jgi:tRNA A-37 threonylcarbamoyl transferase component Bud32